MGSLDSPGTADVVGGKGSIHQAASLCNFAPGLDMGCLKMIGKRLMVRPKFRESDQAWIERIFRHVIGDAAVVLVCCIDQGFEMRKHLLNPVGRKAKDSEYGD
jgi:hypothetical protein